MGWPMLLTLIHPVEEVANPGIRNIPKLSKNRTTTYFFTLCVKSRFTLTEKIAVYYKRTQCIPGDKIADEAREGEICSW
jgi:hypothetical protein